MKVKLFSTVKKNDTQIYDPTTGKVQVLSPEAKPEELLGEFNAREFTAPNGSKYIIVNTPRKEVRVSAETLTKETRVNAFRVEVICGR